VAPTLAAVSSFISSWGDWVVFGVVFLEVVGLPFIPGETALIAAAVLASQGHGSIVTIVALAVAAAFLGAATGYLIGRWRGRELLSFWPWLDRVTGRGVERSDAFFHRHGSKAVFLGRFLPIIRSTLGWMAGIGRMPVRRFMAWNIAGALVWGLLIGLVAYYLGAAVVDAVQRDALIGTGVVVALVVVFVVFHFARRRFEREV
jgi:membrane protein DedA with SNARE-associated domain